MPPYTRGVKLDQLTFVVPITGSLLRYGFSTKSFTSLPGVTATDFAAADLGHQNATAAKTGGGILILRANTPKPARVRKAHKPDATPAEQSSISTFCSAVTLATALTKGWRLAKPARQVSGGTARSTLIVVGTAGAKYAFSMNKNDATTYGTLIGNSPITAADRPNLFSGASQPRPTQMKVWDATKKGWFTTYVDDSKVDGLRTTGWAIAASAIPPVA